MTFRNDLGRPAQIGLCSSTSCSSLSWTIGLDPGAEATEPLPRDGRTRRFLVFGPADRVYGCLVARGASTLPLSAARGCGSGR